MRKFAGTVLLLMSALFLISLNGCLNVQQKTVINEDLSGTINLHYWMKSIGELSYGDEVAHYSFEEFFVRKKYESPFTQLTDLKKFDDNVDTTKHFDLTIAFKDINKITEAPGFAHLQVSYVKGPDGWDFKYVIPRDTALKKSYIKDENKLEYTFVFPKEVKTTNGVKEDTKEGNVVKWTIPVMQISEKDVDLTATIKDKTGICGMFGMELPLILIGGLVLTGLKKKKIIKLFKHEN